MPITDEALRNLHAMGLSDTEIAAYFGCSRENVRVARNRRNLPSNCPGRSNFAKANQAMLSENAIEAGRGGDRLFDRMMGERRFEDHPRAPKASPITPRLYPHTSGHVRSYTGCAASLACV